LLFFPRTHSFNAVNLSLRLKTTPEGKKVEKTGEQKNGWQQVKFQKQLIDYYFFNGKLKI